MVIPLIVEIVFWLGIAAAVVSAIMLMYNDNWVQGVITLIIAPILVRMVCELLIVLFRINDTLTDIKETLMRREEQDKFQVVIKSSDLERAEAAAEAEKHPTVELPLGEFQDLNKK